MDPKNVQVRKVRMSKNRKKGWKKHSNVDEIVEFLEDQRAEERQGGPVVEKADDSLFFVDVKANEEALVDPKPKRRKHNAPLKSLQSLQNSSSVQPPIKAYQLQTTTKKQPRKKVRATQAPKEIVSSVTKDKFFNLWEDEAPKDETEELSKQIVSHHFPKVPIHRYQKPSLLPAVEVPHAGASYNPTFKDHQNLLAAAVGVEVVKEKQEFHLDNVLKRKFPTADKAPTVNTWIEEMSHGLYDSPSDEEEKTDDEGITIFKNWGKPIDRETRKITAQRNAEKAEKLKIKKLAEEKLEKKLKNDFQRIKQIKKELVKKEIMSIEKQKKKDKMKLDSMYKPRRLGKEKYMDPDLEVNLTEELKESLRQVKIEGSILDDRFNSMQKRNIIEPRAKKIMKRKYKLKKQVKRSHREAQEEINKLLKNVKKR